MKIVHVIDYFQPKLGYQEFYLARVQTEEGHDVSVVTSDRYAPGLYPAAQDILGDRIRGNGTFIEEGIQVWRLPITLEFLGRVWLRNLRKVLLKLKPDVIIFHSILSAASITAISLGKDLPDTKIIFDVHMAPIATRKWVKFVYVIFRLLFSRKIINSADALIAVAEDARQFMKTYYRIPAERIKVIPLGCDIRLFRYEKRARKETRRQLKLSKDDIVFIYAGKLTASKGPHLLIKASISLIRKYSTVKVVLVGSGEPEYVNSLRDKATASGLSDHFIFVDMVPNVDLYRYYSAADVGIWPLQSSIAMIEAMACSLPVIIADDSGVSERVSHQNGLLYRSGVEKDLEEKMGLLLDQRRRTIMGQNARKYAEQIDWREISRKFLQLV